MFALHDIYAYIANIGLSVKRILVVDSTTAYGVYYQNASQPRSWRTNNSAYTGRQNSRDPRRSEHDPG